MNYLECGECLKRIYPGETCWTINVHRETPTQERTIRVIESGLGLAILRGDVLQ